jgi:hypothetical protein
MKKNIKKELLTKIESEEIRMKPKVWFLLENGGIKSIWLLLLLAGAVAISMIYYFIKIYSPGQLIDDYGEIGRDLLLTDFPYLWLLGLVVFFGSGVLLMTKIGDNYKKNTKKIVLLMAMLVAITTVVVMIARSLLKF